jgi:hypothetical protein
MDQFELFPDDKAKPKVVDQEKVDKAKARAAEGNYFKDQRQPKSPLIANAELAKMKEILNMPKGGGGYGGGDLEKGMMGGRMKKPSYKKGGVVSSASKRADGCAIKGKTKGRMI